MSARDHLDLVAALEFAIFPFSASEFQPNIGTRVAVVGFWILGSNTSLELENPSGKVAFNSGDSPFLTQAREGAWGRPTPGSGTQTPLARLETNDLLLPSNNRASDAVELVDGLVDGAVYRPGKAIKQVLGLSDRTAIASGQSVDSPAHKTGQVVGSLLPFVGLVGLTRGASTQILGESSSPHVLRLLGEQATAGFLLGSLLTPSDLRPGENLFSARLNQGGISAAIFASITGTTAAIDQELPKPDDSSGAIPNLARRLSISVLSGAVSQFVDVQGKTSFGAPTADSLSASMSSAAVDSLKDGAGKLAKYLAEQEAQRSEPGAKTADSAEDTAKTK